LEQHLFFTQHFLDRQVRRLTAGPTILRDRIVESLAGRLGRFAAKKKGADAKAPAPA
jgi:hypothetical protein